MRTYPVYSRTGELHGFEISNSLLPWRHIQAALDRAGAECAGVPGDGFKVEGIRYVFRLDGRVVIIWEPFGDNSRFLIVPEEAAESFDASMRHLESAFRAYRLPLWLRLARSAVDLSFQELIDRPA